jgi:hypothetical protein
MLLLHASGRQEIEIPEKAADLNLLIGNLSSGKLGTITIPCSKVPKLEAAHGPDGNTAQ